MTEQNGPGRRLQEWNDDFDALVYRPTGARKGAVMNTANEPPTIYRVDIGELSCDCEHGQRGPSDGRSCKHLAKAMLAHPDFSEETEFLVRDMNIYLQRAADAVRALENSRGVAEASASAEAAQQASEGPSETTEDLDPIGSLNRKLQDLGIDPGKFEIWIDDDMGSLQFTQDGYLDDDEYRRLMDWVTDDSVPVNWDRERERNYIKEDDFQEALA